MSASKRRRSGPRPKTGRTPDTRLQQFLDSEGLTSAALEEVTGISRQSMTKIRAGADVRLSTMIRILRGLRVLTGRRVRMEEIFDLDPNDDTPNEILTSAA